MKTETLIKALKAGKILYKDHSDSHERLREFLFCDLDHMTLEAKGWGSAINTPEHRLLEIFYYPDRWKIHSHVGGYPYPWSIGYKQPKSKTK